MLVKHDYRIAKIRKKDFSIENVNNDQEEGKQKDNLVSECPYGICLNQLLVMLSFDFVNHVETIIKLPRIWQVFTKYQI